MSSDREDGLDYLQPELALVAGGTDFSSRIIYDELQLRGIPIDEFIPRRRNQISCRPNLYQLLAELTLVADIIYDELQLRVMPNTKLDELHAKLALVATKLTLVTDIIYDELQLRDGFWSCPLLSRSCIPLMLSCHSLFL